MSRFELASNPLEHLADDKAEPKSGKRVFLLKTFRRHKKMITVKEKANLLIDDLNKIENCRGLFMNYFKYGISSYCNESVGEVNLDESVINLRTEVGR